MYYPLSQITTNLYTEGDEYLILQTKERYIGYYWKTSTGKYFTGNTPQSPNILELIKDIELDPSIRNDLSKTYLTPYSLSEYQEAIPYNRDIDSTYVKLKNIKLDAKILVPSYSPTYPTQQDYQSGEFIRYFCKKVNEIIYLEINKDTYNKLSSQDPTIAFQYYIPFDIPWQLTGDKEQVYKTNKNITELTIKQQKLPQFDLFFKKDYTKYYQ